MADLCIATPKVMQAFRDISSVSGDHLWSIFLIPPTSRATLVDRTVEKVLCSFWRQVKRRNGVTQDRIV